MIAEVESDKATFELPAEASGILHIVAKEKETLPIGGLICRIEIAEAYRLLKRSIKQETVAVLHRAVTNRMRQGILRRQPQKFLVKRESQLIRFRATVWVDELQKKMLRKRKPHRHPQKLRNQNLRVSNSCHNTRRWSQKYPQRKNDFAAQDNRKTIGGCEERNGYVDDI